MPKYLIEREIPGAGKLSQQELQAISQKSCESSVKLDPQSNGLRALSPRIKFIASISHPTKLWFAIMPNREGFRPTGYLIVTMIDPTTAE